jgi:hypothetical protein
VFGNFFDKPIQDALNAKLQNTAIDVVFFRPAGGMIAVSHEPYALTQLYARLTEYYNAKLSDSGVMYIALSPSWMQFIDALVAAYPDLAPAFEYGESQHGEKIFALALHKKPDVHFPSLKELSQNQSLRTAFTALSGFGTGTHHPEDFYALFQEAARE